MVEIIMEKCRFNFDMFNWHLKKVKIVYSSTLISQSNLSPGSLREFENSPGTPVIKIKTGMNLKPSGDKLCLYQMNSRRHIMTMGIC